MNIAPTQQPQRPPVESDRTQATSTETPGTTNDQQQAEYLAAYQLQMRRMSCPGCGEGEPNF